MLRRVVPLPPVPQSKLQKAAALSRAAGMPTGLVRSPSVRNSPRGAGGDAAEALKSPPAGGMGAHKKRELAQIASPTGSVASSSGEHSLLFGFIMNIIRKLYRIYQQANCCERC